MYLITKPPLCAEIIRVPVSKEMTVQAAPWQRNWVSALTKDEAVIKDENDLLLKVSMTKFSSDIPYGGFLSILFSFG